MRNLLQEFKDHINKGTFSYNTKREEIAKIMDIKLWKVYDLSKKLKKENKVKLKVRSKPVKLLNEAITLTPVNDNISIIGSPESIAQFFKLFLNFFAFFVRVIRAIRDYVYCGK